jgi:hypothetical protein
MTVDLNTCVPGQLVELRNGNIVKYVNKYPHNTYPHKAGDCSYTDNGYYYTCREEDDDDVVKIFPLTKPEQPKTDKHPSVAWWESCPWITDRKPMKEDGNQYGFVLATCSTYQTASLVNWDSVSLTMPWIHACNWQPPVLSNKEQALELLNKHEGGWSPTPKEWTIIRKGLTE